MCHSVFTMTNERIEEYLETILYLTNQTTPNRSRAGGYNDL